MDRGESTMLMLRARRELAHLGFFRRLQVYLGAVVLLGEEQWVGWSGKLPIYLFLCPNCGKPAIDYPHGCLPRQYLSCCNSKCQGWMYFIS